MRDPSKRRVMRYFSQRVRLVSRRLARAPLFTSVAVITLAVGVAANAAIFSVVNGVLLKPLPFPDPERLVGVWQTAPGMNLPLLTAPGSRSAPAGATSGRCSSATA